MRFWQVKKASLRIPNQNDFTKVNSAENTKHRRSFENLVRETCILDCSEFTKFEAHAVGDCHFAAGTLAGASGRNRKFVKGQAMLSMLRMSESAKIQDHLFKMYAGESMKEVIRFQNFRLRVETRLKGLLVVFITSAVC